MKSTNHISLFFNITKFFCVIFVLTLVVSVIPNVGAYSSYYLEKANQNNEHDDGFLDSINLHSSTDIETNNGTIVNMDVSSNGYVAVALDNRLILVYDDNGNFIKQFMFNSYGAYYIRWYHDKLELLLVREDLIVEFTLDCKIVGIYPVNPNSKIWRELDEEVNITVNNETYELKNQWLTGYTKLVKTDAQGNELIIYDAGISSIIKNVLIISFFVFAFTCIPYIVLKDQIKYLIAKRKGLLKEQVNENA